ncbi:L-amino-acid oxidase-like [Oscarella lobularis]|uniref:L-amino-acid oxidase-like n=1 Tax=Oscarella lobularis TaxID=121494 RepID=UPI003313E226
METKGYRTLAIILGVGLLCCVIVLAVVIPILATRDADSEGENGPISLNQSCGSSNDILCTNPNDVQDVIIVGGGPAGTYLAYRLRQNNSLTDKKILLLEANDRIGGRLHSVQIPDINYYVAELGGMRYIPDAQPLMVQVINDLGISTRVFEMDEENENRPYLLRDVFVQQKDLTTAKLPYNLKEDEKHQVPNALQSKYYYATVRPSDWNKPPDQAYTVYGDPLYYYGQANVFALANASADAHNYFQDGNGYTYMFPQNPGVAGNLLGVGNDTSLSTGYRSPDDGMQTIPINLADRFAGYANSQVKLNSTVTSVQKRTLGNEQIFVVTVADSVTGEKTNYCGRKVVLALTRSQLKRINWDPLRMSPNAHLVDAVASHKAAKYFLVFSKPWWRDSELLYLNLTKGRTISSLQTRQTFYFTPPTGSGSSLVMAYNDGQNAEFWGSLTDRKFSRYPGTMDFLYQMNDVLVNEAVRQIAINHNTTEDVIGKPVQGVVMYWNHDTVPSDVPNYGPNMPSEAWHMWKAGYNVSEVMKDITQLDPEQEVFIVGSAYSNNQGWVEGAFESVEDLLKDKFSQTSLFQNVKRKRRSIHL